MRLALLSDLHANLLALQACLAHARAQEATGFAFLGDLVGYGADPALMVHASADNPAAWHYVDHPMRAVASLQAGCADPGVRYVFGGHVHHQRLFYAGRRGDLMPFDPSPGSPVPVGPHRQWLATIGSTGQPRDGDCRAMYALWEPPPVARLTFHRVPYDHLAAAQAIRRAGLPEHYARRLQEGR